MNADLRQDELDRLLRLNTELQARLREADDTLAAIRNGDVDALVVGEDVYTLDSANAASNAMRRDVLAQMQDAVLAFDTEDHLIFMNPAAEAQYGCSASEMLGRPREELYRERWAEELSARRYRRALREAGSYRAESVHVRADGREIEVEATVARLDDARGRHLGTLCVVRDIGERKRTEATLRDADARKDEFLATLAHELRNPLAPIRNAVQIMQLSREEGVHENARRIIERQLKQLVHLVDDLLDISRISQGKVELRRENVDVASAVMTAIETSRPLIDAGHHELSIRLAPPRALRVHADLTRLCQIVANLLNNAAKYTPEGGRIEVAAERDGAHALIRVRDSGIGIAREMLPRVFDMFAQVDRSMERAQGGLGIGLALVKRLVEMHGGSVTAASDGPDRGCCFTVCLPLIDDAVERTEQVEARELAPGLANHQRVLVVDDNLDSAESLSQMLAMLGYDTAVAHDGIEAVDAVRAQRPAVVLLDIGMPRMSGLEAACAIRRLPGGDRITLIALSGWGQHEDRRKSREAGFDHHFVKPLDVQALIEVISQLQVRRPQDG
ncbi:ATP-binding protein [Pelomonas sp. KK5]|uniref:hybrid sensor histidine kinase/response regulator n=1 Tax=Pelomonas sp. KK5 TaxID=1855730 RepID=UPI00097CA1A7|nr:ATP-binding protein [Pelomonas sp. KK5]